MGFLLPCEKNLLYYYFLNIQIDGVGYLILAFYMLQDRSHAAPLGTSNFELQNLLLFCLFFLYFWTSSMQSYKPVLMQFSTSH